MTRAARTFLIRASTTLIAACLWAGAAHAQLVGVATQPEPLARIALGNELGVATIAILRGGVMSQASVYRAEPNAQTAAWPEPQPPMFEIGSVSKVFTGLLLAQAVEKGELALTDTLGTLLKGKVDGLSYGVASITLRQLVTHASCLPRQSLTKQSLPQTERELRNMTREQLWAAVAASSVTGGPPCASLYSNFGFAILGELLSERYGKPWPELVRERITGPLGMKDTVVDLGDRQSRMAMPFIGETESPLWDLKAYAGAGGLRSTATDLLVFARAVAAGRNGPLGPAAERLVTSLGAYQGHEIGYGVMMRGAGSRRVLFHTGLTGGYITLWMLLPGGEALVGSVSNSEGKVGKVVDAVDRGMYPLPPRPATADVAAVLPAYEGVYRWGRDEFMAFKMEEGKLYVRGAQQGFVQLTAWGEGRFVLPDRAAQFTFLREGDAAPGLVYQQGGRTITARRDDSARQEYRLPPQEQLSAYLGRYKLPWGAIMQVSADDRQLMARLTKQWRIPVFATPETKDRFAYSVVKAELQFERDDQGKVTAVVLHQNGVHRAPRIGD